MKKKKYKLWDVTISCGESYKDGESGSSIKYKVYAKNIAKAIKIVLKEYYISDSNDMISCNIDIVVNKSKDKISLYANKEGILTL